MNRSNHALIVFAKLPRAGQAKTRLTPFLSPEQAAGLYEAMLRDVIERIRTLSTLVPFLFHVREPGAGRYFRDCCAGMTVLPQEGDDLGERMENAFRKVLGMGYRAAAIIGTDAPDLPLDFIEEAIAVVAGKRADLAVVPSSDGGYCLLAMDRVHGEIFGGIPWSTGEVLRKTMEKARKADLTLRLLPEWHDVDTAEDLERPELLDEGNGAPRTREFLKLQGVI